MATAVLMIGVRPRKVVLCCKKKVRRGWGGRAGIKEACQGLQAAAHRACGRAKVQAANVQTCKTCRRMKRGCGGGKGGVVLGLGEPESSGSVFLWPLRLCNASGRTRLFSGRQNPKKENLETLSCRFGAARERSAYYSKNA